MVRCAAMSNVIEILDIVVWPLVVVGALVFLATKRGSAVVQGIVGSMRRVKAFGVEFELGQEEGRRIKATLEETFTGFRKEVESEFDRQVEIHDVARLCARVAEELIEPCRKDQKEPYRCTVYVPDIVFSDVLYRLLDYYPGGDGKGSIYSARFGIIGRSWRLSEPLHEQIVPGDRKLLIKEWGMTGEEAAGQEAKSFVAFPLRQGPASPAAGLLYVESSEEAFDPDPRTRLEGQPSVEALTEAVAGVMREMRGRGPLLELFQA